MKRAYATILSSDNFIKGVKAVYTGIRKYSKEDFLVFVNKEVSVPIRDSLVALGVTVIEEAEIPIKEGTLTRMQREDRWGKTLFKLVIFKNHGYDKLIYLDSDLLIRGNLDDLFEKPSISAVADADFFPDYSRGGLNAGVMVVEPNEKLFEGLVNKIEAVADKYEVFGDQDVINEYISDWKDSEILHLDVSYNTCFYDSEKVINPKVVHFILADKPWMWSKLNILLKKIKWSVTGRRRQVQYLNEYLRLL